MHVCRSQNQEFAILQIEPIQLSTIRASELTNPLIILAKLARTLAKSECATQRICLIAINAVMSFLRLPKETFIVFDPLRDPTSHSLLIHYA